MGKRGMWHGADGRTRGACWSALLAAVCVIAAGLPAEAQETRSQAEKRLAKQYDAAMVESVQKLAQRLQSDGLPTEPLWDKALEGAAKNVSQGPFLAGLRGYQKRLVEASRALPGPAKTSASALVGAAGALQRGVPPDAVRDVASQASSRGAAGQVIPLVVLGDLVSAGVPVKQARSVVTTALQQGQGDREMLVTSWAVRDLIHKGRGPAEAARQIGRAVGRGRPPTSVPGVGSPPANVPRPGGPPVPPGAGPPGGKGPPGQKGGGQGGSGGSSGG